MQIGNSQITLGSADGTGRTINGNTVTTKVTSSNTNFIPLGIFGGTHGTAPYFAITSSGFGTQVADVFLVDSAGNVGIGITSPTYKLHVAGDIGSTSLTTSGFLSIGTSASIGTNLSVGGTLKLSQGANNGYILQSDASGNASWVTSAVLGTT